MLTRLKTLVLRWFAGPASMFHTSVMAGTAFSFVFALIVYPTSWFYLGYFSLYFLVPGAVIVLAAHGLTNDREITQWLAGAVLLVATYLLCEFIYGSFDGGWWGSGFSCISLLYYAPLLIIASVAARVLLIPIHIMVKRRQPVRTAATRRRPTNRRRLR